MLRTFKTLAAVAFAAVIAGCVIQHGPDGVAYSTPSGGVGATGSAGGGSVSGGSEAPSSSDGEKEQRGNTPIGMDRDGHGPAAGAIVDPTGAATRGKPY